MGRFLLPCLLACSGGAFGHQTGNSYLTVTQAEGRLQVQIDFIVRDLGNLLQSPAYGNASPPDPQQLLGMQPSITSVIQKSLLISVDEDPVPLEFMAQTVVLHNDGLYLRQQLTGGSFASDARFIVVRYGFFTQNDKLGRAFFRMKLDDDEISTVFDQDNSTQRFVLGDTKRLSTIGLFAREGAKHIWEGVDHLLFLLTLLLPGLMLTVAAVSSTGMPLPRGRAAEVFALKVITAFTVAHSITLACSVFGLITLPEKLIESMIVLSIIVSAVLNLQDRLRISHWKLAFFFGLIHGMGFANGLKELGLSQPYFLETLFAFNLGVELGQLSALAAVAAPVLMLARHPEAKRKVMKLGSLAVLLTSALWLVQRLRE